VPGAVDSRSGTAPPRADNILGTVVPSAPRWISDWPGPPALESFTRRAQTCIGLPMRGIWGVQHSRVCGGLHPHGPYSSGTAPTAPGREESWVASVVKSLVMRSMRPFGSACSGWTGPMSCSSSAGRYWTAWMSWSATTLDQVPNPAEYEDLLRRTSVRLDVLQARGYRCVPVRADKPRQFAYHNPFAHTIPRILSGTISPSGRAWLARITTSAVWTSTSTSRLRMPRQPTPSSSR
jgi:hypothetical protein